MSSKEKSSAAAGSGPALTPKLRFPEFQDAGGWRPFALEELEALGWVELGRGEVISNQDIKAVPGNYPIYSSSVKNSGLMGYYGRFMFDEELISWSVDGGGDFFYRPRHKFSVTNVSGYMRLEQSELDYRFTANQLQMLHRSLTFDYQFKAHPSVIRKIYRLAFPLLPEQQKIADCLGSADALIGAQGRKVEALRVHKKGLMQQLFPQEGETQPRLRFPEFEGTGEWAEWDFPEIVFFQEGPGIMAVDFHDDGVPLVRLSGLSGQIVTLEGCNFLDPVKVATKWEHFRLEVGDIVVSCSATFGRPAKVDDAAAGAVFYTGLIRFRPMSRRMDAGYLEVFLGSPNFSRQAEAAAVGGGIRHFGPTHLREMKAPLPPSVDEQQRIADCLTSLDDLIAAEARKLDTLKTHKKGLMQQLFPQVGED